MKIKIKIWLVVVFVFGFFVAVSPARAGTQTQYPTGDGDKSGTWTYTSGTTGWNLIDEAAADDADYTTSPTATGGSYYYFTFSAFSIPSTATIQNVTIYYRHRDVSSGNNNSRAAVKVGTTRYGTTDAGNNPGTSFALRSYAFTLNPATGAAWLPADVNGTGGNPLVQIGWNSSDASPGLRISQLYAVVNYTDPATISISAPNNVTVGEAPYNITYTLADSDDAATAAFYYDTNTDMAGGTAITGACASAGEGTNATCSWNTTGVAAGTYYVYGNTSATPTVVQALSPGTITINDMPTLTISQPPSGNTAIPEGSSFDITYTLSDTDDTVTVAFYYETDGDGAGGTAVSGCGSKAEGTNQTCSFNTSVLTTSQAYYIYGVTSGDSYNSKTTVSSGTITPNDAPTLTVSQPDGTSDTVTAGASYDITYTLTDADSTVTVDFYYDTDSSGLNGTAITGCQNQAEGPGATCSWDTTGITPGDYYVYGRGADDTVNPEATDYSPGMITIEPSGSLSVDIVDSGGTPVGSPSVSFSSKTFDWVIQQSTGILGVSSQKIRVTNTTGTPTWSLAIAATDGNGDLWYNAGLTKSYDFNDSSASVGRLYVNPSITVTPQGGCSTTGIDSSKTAYYFLQTTRDSITLISADGTADTGCYWDIEGVDLTQDIPASQSADSYSIGMTLTAS